MKKIAAEKLVDASGRRQWDVESLSIDQDCQPLSVMKLLINILDAEFERLHKASLEFAATIPAEALFLKRPSGASSCGEYLLRSAAAVEQTFGGITARLWDDPFEWTLPEELSTPEKIIFYVNEVEATRQKGFSYFTSDADLAREIPAPEVLTPIFGLLIDTLARASRLQGRAFAALETAAASEPSVR